jgi:hypothetical protein
MSVVRQTLVAVRALGFPGVRSFAGTYASPAPSEALRIRHARARRPGVTGPASGVSSRRGRVSLWGVPWCRRRVLPRGVSWGRGPGAVSCRGAVGPAPGPAEGPAVGRWPCPPAGRVVGRWPCPPAGRGMQARLCWPCNPFRERVGAPRWLGSRSPKFRSKRDGCLTAPRTCADRPDCVVSAPSEPGRTARRSRSFTADSSTRRVSARHSLRPQDHVGWVFTCQTERCFVRNP